MVWVLIFGSIVVLWLVVTIILVLGLYRKLRVLLRSAARLGRRLDEGVVALGSVGGTPMSRPGPGDVE